jgi:hypothetical protein
VTRAPGGSWQSGLIGGKRPAHGHAARRDARRAPGTLGRPESLRTFAVRFTGQVWPGDELTFTGRVERIKEIGGARLAHLTLAVTRQTGDEAIRATATAVTG